MSQFSIPDLDVNLQSYKVDPITLVDEISATEYYIGVNN